MALVIAELCQNHNGDKRLLQDMIWTAAGCGADYAKIQTIFAEDVTYRERFEEGVVDEGVVKAIKRPYLPEVTRLRGLEMSMDDHAWFIEECEKARIAPLTTVFTRWRIPAVAALPWNAVKVASYDCASVPLLRELAQHFSHLFVSTGGCYDHEIESAAHVLRGVSFTFLHCVSVYPTPLDQVCLARLESLRQFTSSVGFSDHTAAAEDGIKASAVALSLGADVIERHFTVLPRDQTKDGPVSIDAAQLTLLAALAHGDQRLRERYVQEEVGPYEMMMGRPDRQLTPTEFLNRDYYRGRFASRALDGSLLYNWEERPYRPAQRPDGIPA